MKKPLLGLAGGGASALGIPVKSSARIPNGKKQQDGGALLSCSGPSLPVNRETFSSGASKAETSQHIRDAVARLRYSVRAVSGPRAGFKCYVVILGLVVVFSMMGVFDEATLMLIQSSSKLGLGGKSNGEEHSADYEGDSESNRNSNDIVDPPADSSSNIALNGPNNKPTRRFFPDFAGVITRIPRPFKTAARGYQTSARYVSTPNPQDQEASRSAAHPLKLPTLQDPGESYLGFNPKLILHDLRSTPMLVYDVNVIRLSDSFGLVNDMLTDEQIEQTFQNVVDIFAQANIFVRVNRRDLASVQKLSRKKSLIYLGYVEGPDLAEQVDAQKPETSRISKGKKRQEFVEWFRAEMRKFFPVPSVELLMRGPKTGLTSNQGSDLKHEVSDTLSDWSFGFPALLPPWDLAHTTSMFPVFYFHEKSGSSSSAGRVIVRTGGCSKSDDDSENEAFSASMSPAASSPPPPPSKVASTPAQDDVTYATKTIYEGKNVKCKGFESNLYKRVQSDNVQPQQGMEHIPMNDPVVLGRVFAHELAHTMLLLHPGGSTTCTLYPTFKDGNLMVPPHNIGMRNGGGCNNGKIRLEQFKAGVLTPRQAMGIREFVKNRDVRQTRTLPGAFTVGGSTEQIGTQSPYFYDRILKTNKKSMTGAGKKLAFQTVLCKAPQSIVALTKIPAPVDGKVLRVRWMPTRFQIVDNFVHVLVVRPQKLKKGETLANVKTEVTFTVAARTQKTIKVPASTQNSHIEIDIDGGLEMKRGDILAIATMKSRRLNFDTRIFSSDKVLYADVSGQFQHPASNLFEALAEFEIAPSTYPKVPVAPYENDAFFFTDIPFQASSDKVILRKTKADRPEKWCTQVIANYDLIPIA